MIKKIHRIDSDGFLIEDVFLDASRDIPEDCVETKPKEGLHKPKWDSTNLVWVEGLTDAEKLTNAKQAKQNELYQAYQNEKWSQITSSLVGADGLNIVFGYAQKNKEDYLSIVSSFAIDSNQTDSLIGSQSHGKFNITRADMITFKNDMKAHEEGLYTKIKDKLGQVALATTPSEVDAVVW